MAARAHDLAAAVGSAALIQTYARFATLHRRPLAAGAVLLALSNFGQTAVISVFGSGFRQTFLLSNGEFGALYAAATLLAALTLPVLGPRIDGVPVRRFAWTVSLALAGAALLTALSPTLLVFAAGLYAVRLTGFLMAHTALTATARALASDIGKALGLIALGSATAQAILPLLAVAAAQRLGWRWTWGLAAVAVLFAGRAGLSLLPRGLGREQRGAGGRRPADRPRRPALEAGGRMRGLPRCRGRPGGNPAATAQAAVGYEAATRCEGATTLAITSPNGPALRAGPRSLPVVAASGSSGNTSSAKR